MHRLRVQVLCILAGTATSVLLFWGSGASQERPADPLTENERALAEQIALGDEELGSRLAGKRFRLLQIKLAEVPKSSPLVARRAEVILYNYTDDVMMLALVDLHQSAVVALEESHLQPSLHPDELEEAFDLAQGDDRVRRTLAGHQVLAEGVIVTDRTLGEPCFESRCVDLQFRIDGEPSSLVVIVNLSTETVVRVQGE
jgi:hypothetical protein